MSSKIEILLTLLIPCITYGFYKRQEQKRHSIEFKFNIYRDLISHISEITNMAGNIDDDKLYRLSNKLDTASHLIPLYASEFAAQELLEFFDILKEIRYFIEKNENNNNMQEEIRQKHKEYKEKLAKVNNAIRKDTGLKKYKDLNNACFMFRQIKLSKK